MTGIVASGIGAGTMIGPPLAGWLISSYGWRSSYFMIGITTLVLLVFVAQFLKRDPGQIGQLPYGASPYDGSEVKQEGSVSEASGFSRKEAIRTRQFWMLCMAYLSFGISQMAIMVHIVPHATDLGISVIVAANILAIIGALGLFGRITMGGVADRIGNKQASIIGFALLPVALFWLQFAGEPWMFYLFAVIFGLGVAGVGGLIPPVVAELFGMRAYGSILGMVVFAWGAGGAVGPIVAGYIFDTANSYYLAFMVFAILSIVSLVLTLFLKPPHREDSS